MHKLSIREVTWKWREFYNFEIVAKRDFNVKYLFDDNKTVLSGNKSYQRCCHSSILFIPVPPPKCSSKDVFTCLLGRPRPRVGRGGQWTNHHRASTSELLQSNKESTGRLRVWRSESTLDQWWLHSSIYIHWLLFSVKCTKLIWQFARVSSVTTPWVRMWMGVW